MRRRRAVAIILFALAVAGCGSSTPSPTSAAQARAAALLAEVRLPSGARSVSRLPDGGPTAPASSPVCHPLVDRSRLWLVPGTLATTTTYLRANALPGLDADGSASGDLADGEQVASVSFTQGDIGSTQTLVVTYTEVAGQVALRADAEVVPAGASCADSG